MDGKRRDSEMHTDLARGGRLLILHMRYRPDATGTGPLVTELAEDLSARGMRVTVICSVPHYGMARVPAEYRGRLFSHSMEAGVRVIRTWSSAPHTGNVLVRLIDYVLYHLLSTVAALRAGKQDLVLCVAPPITVAITGWLVARLYKAALVFNAQDIWPDGLVAMRKGAARLFLPLLRRLERWVYAVSYKVTVVSPGMARNLAAKGVPADKVLVIPNWVDTAAIRPGARLNRFRQSLGLGDEFIALFAGNLGYAAGLETVILAAERLRSAGDIVFVIVGEGSAKAALVRQAAEIELGNIHFLTTQPSGAFPEVLATADVSLVTLRRGMGGLSVPSKAYAIMASGRPILASVPEDSEIRTLVEAGDCGWTVPPEDPQALAEAILRLQALPDELDRRGRNARVCAEAHHSRHGRTEAYYHLLQGLLPATE